jgi:serine O-acetyltransferase
MPGTPCTTCSFACCRSAVSGISAHSSTVRCCSRRRSAIYREFWDICRSVCAVPSSRHECRKNPARARINQPDHLPAREIAEPLQYARPMAAEIDELSEIGAFDQLIASMVYAQQKRFVGRPARVLLRCGGIDIPAAVKVGRRLRITHAMIGVVVHTLCEIGDDVTLFHGTTLGRSDPWLPLDDNTRLIVGDRAVIGAGAAVLVASGRCLELGPDSVVGANSVLTSSTGPGEIWAGNPARKVGTRTGVSANRTP